MIIYQDGKGNQCKIINSDVWYALEQITSDLENMKPIVNIFNWFTYKRTKNKLKSTFNAILKQTGIEYRFLIGFIEFLKSNEDIFPKEIFNIGITQKNEYTLAFQILGSEFLSKLGLIESDKNVKIIANPNNEEITVNWQPYSMECKRKYKKVIMPIRGYDKVTIAMINSVVSYCVDIFLGGDYNEIEACFRSKFTEQDNI